LRNGFLETLYTNRNSEVPVVMKLSVFVAMIGLGEWVFECAEYWQWKRGMEGDVDSAVKGR